MPRLIDHDLRDREITAAALRVLARDGLPALSVRKVAEEAGLATASLRRAFPSQDTLRRHCLDLVRHQVAARAAALDGEGLDRVEALLAELLPLDETRRVELTVQLQLGTLALTDPDLRPAREEMHRDVRRGCRAAVAELDRVGLVAAGRDREAEADTLHALLDGVALHLLWDPAPVATTLPEPLRRFLRGLASG